MTSFCDVRLPSTMRNIYVHGMRRPNKLQDSFDSITEDQRPSFNVSRKQDLGFSNMS